MNQSQTFIESLIGKTEIQATSIIRARGCPMWVLMRDSTVSVPVDKIASRIKLVIINGLISSASWG